ncbi:MAG: carbohydrate kinase, partial [Deltaproteobacteria bacterium]|nr:carbohydrate kinase [Deltaproteobacteria bacterium]
MKKPNELILSIDCGTQSIRAGLVDLTGAISGLVKTPIEPYFSANPGWTEQHPEYYWQMLCKTCRELLVENKNLKERICAVTLTTQRATFINLDKDGKPLRPAIVWLDQRKASIKGILPGLSHPFLKALRLFEFVEFAVQYCRSNWIQQNQPDIWDRTHKYLYLSGYFT